MHSRTRELHREIRERTATGEVEYLLKRLAAIQVPIPEVGRTTLLDRLNELPRSGKAVRIERYQLGLPVQSVSDHIRMLGVLGETLQGLSQAPFAASQFAELAVFHDLAETLIGDVPHFTSAELAGHTHRTEQEKVEAEHMANSALAKVLPSSLRNRFGHALTLLEDGSSPEAQFFHMLDKFEPIISVWRYLQQFRERIDIATFLEAMHDFFTNPNVVPTAVHPDMTVLGRFLQSPEQAANYHRLGQAALVIGESSPFTPAALEQMFATPLDFVHTETEKSE